MSQNLNLQKTQYCVSLKYSSLSGDLVYCARFDFCVSSDAMNNKSAEINRRFRTFRRKLIARVDLLSDGSFFIAYADHRTSSASIFARTTYCALDLEERQDKKGEINRFERSELLNVVRRCVRSLICARNHNHMASGANGSRTSMRRSSRSGRGSSWWTNRRWLFQNAFQRRMCRIVTAYRMRPPLQRENRVKRRRLSRREFL